MRYNILFISLLFFIPACSENPLMPESAAKHFVHSYFVKEKRNDLLKNVTGSARLKLDAENEYSKHLDIQDIEIETPSVFQLIDSFQVDQEHRQYTFSILYHGSISRLETLQITVVNMSGEWKVSDYHFIGTVDL